MDNHLTKGRFDKLGLWYMLALSGIAGVIISTQILIQRAINKQQDDSRVINVAGRQRMLSQQISKNVLKINTELFKDSIQKIQRELTGALQLWKTSHQGLLQGDQTLGLKGQNSLIVNQMFRQIQPHYQAMVAHTDTILYYLKKPVYAQAELRPHINKVLFHEGVFLQQMDQIVFQYDEEARTKVISLKQTEIALLIISLAIIFFEVAFIFMPTSKNVKRTVASLIRSENIAKKMAREIEVLYNTLETSYQQLADVDAEEEQPTLLIKTDTFGNITYFSEKLQNLLEFDHIPINLFNWLENEGYQREFLDGLMDSVTAGESWNGEVKVQTQDGDFLWLNTHLIPVFNKPDNAELPEDDIEMMVVGANVTELKEAKERSKEINRARIEKQVKEKQHRSVLILEGQEEERKRIARDIHDGIGQMLIALKFNLEATIIADHQQTKLRIQESRGILKNIIKEVRRVAFNLTPSSLNDFGLAPTIKKFCTEVGELMGINVTFENKTHFINRLNTKVETHLYRIIQEGVNNAIKYAQATQISVVFSHNLHKLNIEIVDNGTGFDYASLQEKGHFAESGHGLFNMRERASFINGQFEIETAVGEGTKIKVGVPIN
ncbi:histidine kinase [marine bacterium AO1-C]|nr:histidine kinase [marine bacterium AO1-C]